jgi:hypothetical protein
MKEWTMRKRSNYWKYKIAQYHDDIPKPKKGQIAIVPMDNRVIDFPPFVGKNTLPSWWKNLNKGRGSIRRCQGTYDYVSYGMTMPLWTNVKVRPNINNSGYEVRTDRVDDHVTFPVEGFHAESASGCPIEHTKSIKSGQYIKLVSPWRFITSKGVSLMTLPMLFEPDPRYSVVAGIVHTDYYHQINVVIIVHTDEEFTIPAGTPIQHMIPIRRDDNFDEIVWGNESMFKFIAHSGLGEGHLVHEDKEKSTIYRKLQRRADENILKERLNKKWFNFLKK